MNQKVLRIGSSVGITLSKKVLAELSLSIGDLVNVEVDGASKAVVIRPAAAQVAGKNQEVIDWTRSFIKQYRGALDTLKDS